MSVDLDRSAPSAVRDAASFRDPAGFVFHRDGVVYRQIDASFADRWEAVVASGLLERLQVAGGAPIGSPSGPHEGDPGLLAASGLVAGEGLAGVLIAALVALGVVGKSRPPLLDGAAGAVGALLLVAAVGALLFRAGRSRAQPE